LARIRADPRPVRILVRSLLLSLAMAPAAPVHAALPEKASIAVVLNANAKAVDEQLIRDLKGLLQDETLFVSHSLEQGRFIARHLVNRRFDVVLCGGGDGTFTQVVSEVARLRPAAMPAFGALQLGTGNGIGEALGAGRGLSGLAADLRAAREPARLTLPLLEVEGKRMTVFREQLIVGGEPVVAYDEPRTGGGFVIGDTAQISIEGRGEVLAPGNELKVIGKRVEEALPLVDKFLDDATLSGLRTVRVIHGHGTGALRRAVAELLDGHPHVAGFRTAAQQEGGAGVTVVQLRE